MTVQELLKQYPTEIRDIVVGIVLENAFIGGDLNQYDNIVKCLDSYYHKLKGWEIMSFKAKGIDGIEDGTILPKDYEHREYNFSSKYRYFSEEWLLKEDQEIWAVRRASDWVVFQPGDPIKLSEPVYDWGQYAKIKSFRVTDDGQLAFTYTIGESWEDEMIGFNFRSDQESFFNRNLS